MRYFFDVQGTLVGNSAIAEHEVVELLRLLRLMGHEVIVWSGYGHAAARWLRSPLREAVGDVRLKEPNHYLHIMRAGGATCVDDADSILEFCERAGALTIQARELHEFYEHTCLMAETPWAIARGEEDARMRAAKA